jgi:hypothetical protein
MIGITLLWCFLAAFFGGVVLSCIGSLKALAGGEAWNWAKFALSLFFALASAAGYYGIASKMPPATDLWIAVFAAFTWGCAVETAQSQLIGVALLKNKSPTQKP